MALVKALLLTALLLPAGSAVAAEDPAPYVRELLASDASLGPVVERVNRLPPARFDGADEKEEVVGALDEIRGFLELLSTGIADVKLPPPLEVLRQSLAEARLVKAVLEAFVKGAGPLAAAERATIVQISEDMNLKAAGFDEWRRKGEGHWRGARVRVRVRGADDEAPVAGLRVYWVPRLLAGVPAEIREVPSLEPEVALELPEASYLIWAGTVAGPQPLSPQIRVDVRRQEGEREILVTLPVPRR